MELAGGSGGAVEPIGWLASAFPPFLRRNRVRLPKSIVLLDQLCDNTRLSATAKETDRQLNRAGS